MNYLLRTIVLGPAGAGRSLFRDALRRDFVFDAAQPHRATFGAECNVRTATFADAEAVVQLWEPHSLAEGRRMGDDIDPFVIARGCCGAWLVVTADAAREALGLLRRARTHAACTGVTLIVALAAGQSEAQARAVCGDALDALAGADEVPPSVHFWHAHETELCAVEAIEIFHDGVRQILTANWPDVFEVPDEKSGEIADAEETRWCCCWRWQWCWRRASVLRF